MLCRHLHVFPVLMALYLPVTFFISYGMAIHYDHVEPLFPYISDTGTITPESCVFGQLLNIYAALIVWCMYLRYKQVRRYYRFVEQQGLESGSDRSRSVRCKQRINKACLVVGIFTALGISMVGNFQEDNVLEVHLLGAMMTFGGAGLYCWVQSLISYKMANLPCSRPWCRHARVVLCVIYSIAFLIMVICTKLSMDKFPLEIKDMKKWKSSQPGYAEHLCATFAEWVMAFSSSAYFLTFMGELKVVRTKVLLLPLRPEASLQDEHNNKATTTSNTTVISSTSHGADNDDDDDDEDILSWEDADVRGAEPRGHSDAPSVIEAGAGEGCDGGTGGGGGVGVVERQEGVVERQEGASPVVLLTVVSDKSCEQTMPNIST